MSDNPFRRLLSRLNLAGGSHGRGRHQYLSQNDSGPMRVFSMDTPHKALGRQYLGFGHYWIQGGAPYACGWGSGMSMRQVLLNAHRAFSVARPVAASGGKLARAVCDNAGCRRLVVLKFGEARAEISPVEAIRLADELRAAAALVAALEAPRG